MKTCCFTGHRTQKMNPRDNKTDFINKLRELTKKEIIKAIENGYTKFITGMALGFDLIAGEVVLELKKEYDIVLSCALPCPNQHKYWTEKDKKRFERIIENADEVQCVCDKYHGGCMQIRNRFMVDNSSLIIAYYNGSEGGTKQTINYAINQGKNIKILNI